MLKVDWTTLILLSVLISMITEYWIGQSLFAWLETWIAKRSAWWHTFFFCRFCIVGKLSMLCVMFIRPVMFLKIMPYPVWTIVEWGINWLCLNFIALVADRILNRTIREGDIIQGIDKNINV